MWWVGRIGSDRITDKRIWESLVPQVCKAMSALHEHHRMVGFPLSQVNVLVTQDSVNNIYAALSDFSNAKKLATPEYAFLEIKKVSSKRLAPEYVAQSEPRKYSKQCDVYTFSIFAWELLSNVESVWVKGTGKSVMMQISGLFLFVVIWNDVFCLDGFFEYVFVTTILWLGSGV